MPQPILPVTLTCPTPIPTRDPCMSHPHSHPRPRHNPERTLRQPTTTISGLCTTPRRCWTCSNRRHTTRHFRLGMWMSSFLVIFSYLMHACATTFRAPCHHRNPLNLSTSIQFRKQQRLMLPSLIHACLLRTPTSGPHTSPRSNRNPDCGCKIIFCSAYHSQLPSS